MALGHRRAPSLRARALAKSLRHWHRWRRRQQPRAPAGRCSEAVALGRTAVWNGSSSGFCREFQFGLSRCETQAQGLGFKLTVSAGPLRVTRFVGERRYGGRFGPARHG